MAAVSDELITCTDDCSYGRGGVVTEPLTELLEARGKEIVRIWAIGPAIMMKFVALTTKPYNVPTIVSLNTVMVDGTGMCGGCRVVLEDGAQFACVDGPEFDGHKVNWDILLSRLQFYHEQEQTALERWKKQYAHQECQLAEVGI
jgi:ferredoxin--NADP+ reductase